ncbi:MAG TPA: hypothetical protein HA269_08155 [Ferroplasma sp.]|nr:hypothetical protein [Ferroplasma sp.]
MKESNKDITRRIREKAYEIIKERPSGIRFSELVNVIIKENPDFNINTINAQIANLRNHKDYKDKLSQIPGIYMAIEYENNPNLPSKNVAESETNSIKHYEKEFYEPFANFLKGDLNECTAAKDMGNSRLQFKWSTPDVVGYSKVKTTSGFKSHPELVACELKVETTYDALIKAFAQAVSYLLFCHKSYIAVPEDTPLNALTRLENLCILFGIGLILFDRTDPNKPEFKIRNRALRHEPNIFSLNDEGVKITNFIDEGKL